MCSILVRMCAMSLQLHTAATGFFSPPAIHAAKFPPFIIIATAHTFTSLQWDRIFSVNGISDLATNRKKSHSSLRSLSFLSFFLVHRFCWSINTIQQQCREIHQFGYNKCHEYKLHKLSHYDIVCGSFFPYICIDIRTIIFFCSGLSM